MFKNLSKLFGAQNDDQKTKESKLPDEVMDLIHIFTQNIELLESIPTDSDRISLLSRLILQFDDAFSKVQKEHLNDPEIKTSLEKFSYFCGIYGSSLLTNTEISSLMFAALTFISSIFSTLPHSKSFISLFCGIVQNSKQNPNILESSYGIITLLFTSMPFFFEFVEMDGFSLIFTTFFLETMEHDCQSFWINLLFSVIPEEYFSMPPSDTIFDIFLNTLSAKQKEEIPYDQCSIFICSYISVFYPSNHEIIKSFSDINGWNLLASFIAKHCPHTIQTTFPKLIIATQANATVIQCLNNVFLSEDANQNIRHLALECYISINKQNPKLREEIFNCSPISQWFLKPPKLKKESLDLLIAFASEMVSRDIVPIQVFLPQLLSLAAPPANHDVPIDKFFELILRELLRGKLFPDEMVENRFLEDFVLMPDSKQLAWWMSAFPSFTKIITNIYSAQAAQEFRFPVIQAFINASQYLSDFPSFVQFLSGLFTRHFSSQIVHLLLNFLNSEDLVKLLTQEIAKRPEAPDYFLEANGPRICVDFVQDSHPEKNELILRLIATAASYGQREEIDDVLNSLSPDHPIFKCSEAALTDACFGLRHSDAVKVPSLLPYVKSYNTKSPANCYIIGKYGIKAFEKRGIKLEDIKGIGDIINRYAPQEKINDLLKLGRFFDSRSDCFSLVELQATQKPAFCTAKFGAQSITFWFKLLPNHDKIHYIGSCGSFSITVQENKKIVFNSVKDAMTVNCSSIMDSEWVNISLTFQLSVRSNNIQSITVFVNGVDYGQIKAQDEQISSTFTFGDSQGPIRSTILFSTHVFVSNNEINASTAMHIYRMGPSCSDFGPAFKQSDLKCEKSAVYVGYLGIASYFTTLQDFEAFFEYAEECETFGEFKDAVRGLISIRQCIRFKITEFYTRLCFTLKRQAKLISEHCDDFINAIPYNQSTMQKRTKAMAIILSDVELFNVLSKEASVSILCFVTATLGAFFDISELEKSGCFDSLIALMRSGVDVEVSIAACPVVGKLMTLNTTEHKIRSFLNICVSSSEWSHGLPTSLTDFPISSLLTMPMSETPLQNKLLKVFTNTVKMLHDIELFSFTTLTELMYLFDDERCLYFAELICFYSQRNANFIPQQITHTQMFAFAKKSTLKKMWAYSFCIFGALPVSKVFPQRLTIERPNFCPVILEMLCTLMSHVAYTAIFKTKNEEVAQLAAHVLTLLTAVPDDQFAHFVNPQCIDLLYTLLNLGIVPQSLLGDNDGERQEYLWQKRVTEKLTKDEIKSIRQFIGENEYTDTIFQLDELTQAQTDSVFYDVEQQNMQFPFDCLDSEWFKEIGSLQTLASFFASILLASEPSLFVEFLSDLFEGTSLMYGPFKRDFGNELVCQLLIRLVISDEPLQNYHKPLIIFLKECISHKCFEGNYIHMLSLLFNLLKSVEIRGAFDEFFSDPETKSCYREILLASFVYVPKQQYFELFQLLSASKTVVFQPLIFDDSTFSFYWMYLTKNHDFDNEDLYLCISLFLALFDNEMMSEFNPDEVKIAWDEHETLLKLELAENKEKLDEKSIKHVIALQQSVMRSAIIQKLKMSIYRTANIYVQSNISVHTLNIIMRRLERSFFKYTLLKKQIELKFNDNEEQRISLSSLNGEVEENTGVDCSYHLSPLSLPVYQPRAIVRSPFPVKCPPFDTQLDYKFFAVKYTEKPQRVHQLETNGVSICCPELCYFHEDSDENFTSPFEYSKVIIQSPKSMLELFHKSFPELQPLVHQTPLEVGFYNYIHEIPSLLFIGERVCCLLILAQLEGKGISLLKLPPGPIAFLPFTESVAMSEWSCSLFCGHIVLTFDLDSILLVRRHLIIHKPIGLSISFFMQPPLIITFKTADQCDQSMRQLQKRKLSNLPNYPFLFSMQDPSQAMSLWVDCRMTSFDYLLVLNSFGGRSFSDLAQYPVVPWVSSPDLESRDLSLPMGQLGKTRARHYDQTYELSSPHYFYGFHYSLPGAVFWLMMRLPPFTFFGWDLNEGWDEPGRLFFSVQDAYASAAFKNPSDLKELVPEMYCVPELLLNMCHLSLPERPSKKIYVSNSCPSFTVPPEIKGSESTPSLLIHSITNEQDSEVPQSKLVPEAAVDQNQDSPVRKEEKRKNDGTVILPEWSTDAYVFTDVMRKTLEHCVGLNDWIDLIFGYKQLGEAALEAKNIFLPSSYHTSKPSDLDMDEQAFQAQVVNFGQCPNQLFTKPHPERNTIERPPIALIEQKALVADAELKNPFGLRDFVLGDKCLCLPKISAMIPPSYTSFVTINNDKLSIISTVKQVVQPGIPITYSPGQDTETQSEEVFSISGPDYDYATDIACSSDGLFCSIAFSTGVVRVFRIVFDNSLPKSLKYVTEMRFHHPAVKTALISQDYMAAVSLTNGKVILWSIATNLHHRMIDFGETCNTLFFDTFGSVITCVSATKVCQYTINGHLLRSIVFDDLNQVNDDSSLSSGQSSGNVPQTPRPRRMSIGLSHKRLSGSSASLNTSSSAIFNLTPPTCVFACQFNIDDSFDGRVLLCGFSNGYVEFFCVDSSSPFLSLIGEKQVSKFLLKSVFCDPTRCECYICDKRNKCFKIHVKTHEATQQRCISCKAPQTTKCSRCNAPLCDSCKEQYSNLCPNCAREIDLLATFRF